MDRLHHVNEPGGGRRGSPRRCIRSVSLDPGFVLAILRQVLPTHFKVIGKIQGVQTIATNRSIRAITYLRRKYGARDWRKRKGVAKVQLDDGTIGRGEVHWYEAHGIGKKELKLKWFRED